MIAILARLALGAGVPPRFAKAVGIAAAVIALIAVLGVAKCSYDKSIIEQDRLEERAKDAEAARKADEKAADRRLNDERTIDNDDRAMRDAIDATPAEPLTARQRARACAILCRQARAAGIDASAECRPCPGA